jgi:hypothetical protein
MQPLVSTKARISTRDSCQILMKLEFFRQIFEKYSNIKFHEDPSSGTDRRTDVTKLIVAFRNFAKASKNDIHISYRQGEIRRLKIGIGGRQGCYLSFFSDCSANTLKGMETSK